MLYCTCILYLCACNGSLFTCKYPLKQRYGIDYLTYGHFVPLYIVYIFRYFDVLLTVHFSIILVINRLNAQILVL